MAYNYELQGLKILARLVLMAQEQKGWSRKQMARQAGIADGTIKNIEKNLELAEGATPHEPSIATLEMLAPQLTNPQTGDPFTGDELYQLCKGRLEIPEELLGPTNADNTRNSIENGRFK
jgi:transcriptional regulator with XRE-family HTH domain